MECAGSHLVVVAHVTLVSAQVVLVLTLGFWTSDLGLTIIYPSKHFSDNEFKLLKNNTFLGSNLITELTKDKQCRLQV